MFAGALPAQPPGRLGDEFQVNTYTTDNQWVPAVGAAPDGAFVVVWESYGSPGSDTDRASIQARRFDGGGDPLGPQFEVNTHTYLSQIDPRVAVNAGGGFVVVWTDLAGGPPGDGVAIFGRRYAPDGLPAAPPFFVNTATAVSQQKPAVAMAPSGEFVVVWHAWLQAGSDTSDASIQGQRFAADGAPLGGQFQANALITGRQSSARVAAAPDGGFVVVWTSEVSGGSDTDSTSIQGRRFDADGVPLGAQFQVNSYTPNAQKQADVAVRGDGSFLVAWSSSGSSGSDGSDDAVLAQRYEPDGTPAGDEFQINVHTTGNQHLPAVAAAPDGFVVAWHSYASAGTDAGASVQVRSVDAQGGFAGPELQVNTYTPGDQTWPNVAVAPGGDLVVVWQSDGSAGTDADLASIQGQRFRPGLLFLDGFETGDTSRWSSAEP